LFSDLIPSEKERFQKRLELPLMFCPEEGDTCGGKGLENVGDRAGLAGQAEKRANIRQWLNHESALGPAGVGEIQITIGAFDGTGIEDINVDDPGSVAVFCADPPHIRLNLMNGIRKSREIHG